MMDTLCPVCDEEDSMVQTTHGRYLHLFWLPLFPLGRKHSARCSNCETEFKRKEFDRFVRNGYEYSKPWETIKRPWWHWLGSGIILSLIALISVASAVGYSMVGEEVEALRKDPAYQQLQWDLSIVNDESFSGPDTLVSVIRACVEGYDSPEWQEEHIHYLVRTNRSKTLILLDYDRAKEISSSNRHFILKRISLCLDTLNLVNPDSVYYGLHGRWNLLAASSPSGEAKGGIFASDSLLLGFYR